MRDPWFWAGRQAGPRSGESQKKPSSQIDLEGRSTKVHLQEDGKFSICVAQIAYCGVVGKCRILQCDRTTSQLHSVARNPLILRVTTVTVIEAP